MVQSWKSNTFTFNFISNSFVLAVLFLSLRHISCHSKIFFNGCSVEVSPFPNITVHYPLDKMDCRPSCALENSMQNWKATKKINK